MPALQIKDCPEDVYASLKQCAARENRSIAQQTLTIIEDYLDQLNRPPARTSSVTTTRRSYALRDDPNVDYLTRRRATLDRINKLPPIPNIDNLPDSAELLRQIREEEAR